MPEVYYRNQALMMFEAEQMRSFRHRAFTFPQRPRQQSLFSLPNLSLEGSPGEILYFVNLTLSNSQRFNHFLSARDQALAGQWVLRLLQEFRGGLIDRNQLRRRRLTR